MRILIALPGLHRVDRGAEVAFLAVANALAAAGEDVTVIGSGNTRPGMRYDFRHTGSIRRERFEFMPSVPGFRDDCAYEDLTFAANLLTRYKPSDYDVTLTCNYPYTNWALRWRRNGAGMPRHVFVTQNGDWPAFANKSEFRFFGCDGLICTNPDFFNRNNVRWRCALIPNGVDTGRFRPGPPRRADFGLPESVPIILMVSALIPSKRVGLGIDVASLLPDCHLVVAGEGPLRVELDDRASKLLPGRFTRLSVAPDKMPDLYRSADVFMHLSKVESFGNVFLEAMACGLPVVAPDSERLRWIVGADEHLFASDAPADIASSVTAALNAPQRPDTIRDGKVDRFAWPRIGAMYRDFLTEIVGSPAEPHHEHH